MMWRYVQDLFRNSKAHKLINSLKYVRQACLLYPNTHTKRGLNSCIPQDHFCCEERIITIFVSLTYWNFEFIVAWIIKSQLHVYINKEKH